MTDMPRPRPPGLNRDVSRHGKERWYVRTQHGKRIRLSATYGTNEFWAQYRAALEGAAPGEKSAAVSEATLEWLIGQYRLSPKFTNLAISTRRARENVLKRIIAKAGADAYADVRDVDVLATRDALAPKPESANIYVRTMRGLYDWAKTKRLVTVNPAAGVTLFPSSESGFLPWDDADLERFEKRWKVGTRERLAFDLLLYTGLRRSDAVRLGKQHVKGGVLSITTAKTGAVVTLPLLAPLAASIEATRTGDLAFIVGEHGRPFTKESFGNWFRDACNAAGVTKAAHGLRKAGATRAAENGATTHELMAMFGWATVKEAERYTRAADRKRMGMQAGTKLLLPSPANKVRAEG
jgi:integrase